MPAIDTTLSDADMVYLELTAKHAPAELGTEEYGKKVLALLDMYNTSQANLDLLREEVVSTCDSLSEALGII